MRSGTISESDLESIVIPLLNNVIALVVTPFHKSIYLKKKKKVEVSLLFVVWRMTAKMISLSGEFIQHVHLFALGQASVSSSPQGVSSAQGKRLQWLIPPAHYKQGTSRRGFECWEHQLWNKRTHLGIFFNGCTSTLMGFQYWFITKSINKYISLYAALNWDGSSS